jgi:chromosomal replication initiator protein
VDESVLNFLAEKIRTNVRRLEGALMRVATFASLPASVRHGGQGRAPAARPDPRGGQPPGQHRRHPEAVAEHFDVRLADMTSRRRPASIAFPRQVAMFLSRSLTKGSLMEIGEAFGGRDHGTVIHACGRAEDS